MTSPAVRVPVPDSTKTPARTAAGRFNSVVEWACRRLLRFVRIDPDAVERVRELSRSCAVIYIMRYRSWVDYVLATYILKREGLPLPVFVNGVSPLWFQPLGAMLRHVWGRLTAPITAREIREHAGRERCRQLVEQGQPVLIFMRSLLPGFRLIGRRRHAVAEVNTSSDYLREIVHYLWSADIDVALVPIAVFRGRGMRRKDSRFGTVVYSLRDVPTEFRRLVSLLWNTHETSLRVGREVRLRDFIRQYQSEGEERLVRRLGRALQIFLYREERLVWGPPLLPKAKVKEQVVQSDELRATVRQLAAEQHVPEAQLMQTAERYFDEMAANFHGFYFSILEFLFNRIWPRVFQGLEYSGLERVAECVKQHPVVLVPCHRSHFDYLILSYIFHLNYLSPPHIAAGINLSFWPLGPLFRGAGAYFIRRSFEGNDLYKAVFRSYLTFLIRQGYTQEFFIEGGRSRTGKILTPKLGVLSALVDSFLLGVRRDLYFVPVSIQYGRVVEEQAYQRELTGAEKEKESLLGLFKARTVLRRRHGTAYVTFAEPISLHDELGERRERFRDPNYEEEKRRFVQKFGFRLLREVNNVTVAGATSVSATVLLSVPNPAVRHREFVRRALALVSYLRWRGVQLSMACERNAAGEFRESLSFLSTGGLVELLSAEGETVIHVPDDYRLGLDFYKNNTVHYFLVPSLVSDALMRGLDGEQLREDVAWWLAFLRWEFPLPERDETGREIDAVYGYIANTVGDELYEHPFIVATRGILDNFREGYWVVAQTLRSLPQGGMARKALMKEFQERYRTALLLREVSKPEGSSTVIFGNALNRYAELGFVIIRPGKGRDPIIERGPKFEEIPFVGDRVRAALLAQKEWARSESARTAAPAKAPFAG